MHILHKKTCRVCGLRTLRPVIDLQPQYLQGSFVKPGIQQAPLRKLPTMLVRCDTAEDEDACGLLQLAHSIPPEILYANYWYRSGTNATMQNHLKSVVAEALSIVTVAESRVLDIGCNDGTLLKAYSDRFERWGFDPSDIAQSIGPPIKVVGTVFPSSQGRALLGEAKFDIVTAIAMFYDIENPVEFARSVKHLLAPKGIWIVELSYLPLMLRMNSFDTICHEHLEYYSLAVLRYVMRKANLRVFRVGLNPINGGSIRCFICHEDCVDYDTREAHDYMRRLGIMEFEMQLDSDLPYDAFQRRIERLRSEMNGLITEAHKRGEKIHIYGASTKGNVLLQWYNIDSFKIEYAADRNPDKDGAMTLGTNIRIISEERSRAMKPDYYLVLPWHFRREFLEREAATIRAGTKMIFPLPEITIVDRNNLEKHLAQADVSKGSLEQLLDL